MRMLTLLLALILLPSAAAALTNQLADHPSPYLAMHAEDPVAWQTWSAATIELARREQKLMLVSSGYFSCHWCHVMQRESYRSPEIARLLNDHFIPIKVDRELEGALDAHLIDFLERTQGQAGWPLNVFLTPDGYPLIGATYLPPERFDKVLRGLMTSWQNERDHLQNLARRTLLALNARKPAADAVPLTGETLIDQFVAAALGFADPMEGGFGAQSRFPMTPQLSTLLDAFERHPSLPLQQFLELTLNQIATEGLRDHLGGGFFRYTVDPSWQIPHYEKMLYTQAQLAEVFLRAGHVLGNPGYIEVAKDTLDFVLREMQGEKGGFIASFSAIDESGLEGGYYLWTHGELIRVLGDEDAALAARYWRMHGGHLDESYLPRFDGVAALQIDSATTSPQALHARVSSIRAALLCRRDNRGLPADTKELAGWNGLLLAAFSRAAAMTGESRYAEAAERLFDYLRGTLWDDELIRARDGGTRLGRASLADYAYVAYGVAAWAGVTTEPQQARRWLAALLDQAWSRFYSDNGWRLDDRPLIPGLGVHEAIVEGALPAPSAMLIGLSLSSANRVIRENAIVARERARALAQGDPFWHAGHVRELWRTLPRKDSGNS